MLLCYAVFTEFSAVFLSLTISDKIEKDPPINVQSWLFFLLLNISRAREVAGETKTKSGFSFFVDIALIFENGFIFSPRFLLRKSRLRINDLLKLEQEFL